MSGASAAQRAIRARRSDEPEVLSLQELHASGRTPRAARERRVSEPHALPARAARGRGARRAPARRLRPHLRPRPRRARATRGRASSTCSPRATGGEGGAASGPTCRARSPSPASDPAPGGGADLQFLLEDVGPGTRRLAELKAGRGADAARPAGRAASRPPPRGSTAVLVGGGIGTAPILALHDERPAAPGGAGFRSAAHAEAAALFGEVAALMTDDGSAGRQGLVTEPLREHLDADPAGHRLRLRPAADAGGGASALRGARNAAPSWPWRPEWPAATAPASAAWCRPRTGYKRVCVDGPVFDAADAGDARP